MTEDTPRELQRRQFLVCRFSPGDRRVYTYCNDMEPVVAGDRVEVHTSRGLTVVLVEAVSGFDPGFTTKHIAGLYRPDGISTDATGE